MEGGRRKRQKMIEIYGAIAPENFRLAPKVLHRETKWVKFKRTRVIFGKLTDRDKVFN